jgi:DNA ligase-1
METTTLYKKTSSGSLRQWTINLYETLSAGDSPSFWAYITSDGQVGGKIKTSKPTVVNAGKASRSIYEQAKSQVESKINKKLDSGYKETEQEALDDVFISPMLAVDFKKRGHSMQYPAIGQRKFDGVRCIAYNDGGKIVLESRKGKAFPHMNHLRASVFDLLNKDNQILDGELYSDVLDFQRVVGLVRKESLSQQDIYDLKHIKYRIYDMFSTDDSVTQLPFVQRHAMAEKLIKNDQHLIIVENYEITDEDSIQGLHDQFVQEGYEGIMVRNPSMPYQMDKRSSGLMKFKSFKDGEYPIVGYTEATGNDAGTVIWICEAPNGITFKARPTGTREQRTTWFENADEIVGKDLTVRYFELTNDGIPRFPVGVAIRDYE